MKSAETSGARKTLKERKVCDTSEKNVKTRDRKIMRIVRTTKQQCPLPCNAMITFLELWKPLHLCKEARDLITVGRMKRWIIRSSRFRVKDIVILMGVFFMCFSFFQILITPMPNDAEREHEVFKQQLQLIEREKGADFFKNKLIFKEEKMEEAMERQISQEDDENIPKISMIGIQELPKPYHNVQLIHPPHKYEFRIQPDRVIGPYGLLKTRELQGHTFAGSFMKAALVIMVNSVVQSSARRAVLRRSWASIRDIEGWKIETVFVVGSAGTIKQQNQLSMESQTYGDLLQYYGADGPSSAIDKNLASLEWADETLPGDFIYASTQDDVIINIARVRDYLNERLLPLKPPARLVIVTSQDGSTMVSGQYQNLYCFDTYTWEEVVERNLERKRAVTTSQYAGDKWPPYCGEGLYAMPVTLARDISTVARALKTRLSPGLSDVFVTGIARRLLGRGDDNIVTATGDEVGWTPIQRFPMLSKKESKVDSSKVLSIPSPLAADMVPALETWQKWYGALQARYHIYTNLS